MTQPSQVAPGQQIDVADIIDRRGIRGFNLRLILASWLVTAFDGFDLSLAAFTAPYIRDELQLDAGHVANILSAGLLGMTLGSLLLSSLSDRIGRRKVVIGCAFAFSVLTVATGFAQSYEALVVLRLLDGFAIGGVVPIIWALNVEYAPRRTRATIITIIMVGYSVGISGAGPLTVLLEPYLGWRGVFIAGGLGSAVSAILLVFTLPESIRWLIVRGNRRAQVAALIRRLDPKVPPPTAETEFLLSDEPDADRHSRFRDLFSGWLAIGTPLIWIAFAASSVAIYYVNGWGPIILEDIGFPRDTAALATAFGGIMGSVAGLVLMRFTDRLGTVTLLFYPVLLLPILLILGLVPLSQATVLNLAMLVLALIGGMQFAIMSIIGPLYPTAIRARGSGWASSLGKLGGVFGPIMGGALMASDIPVIRSYAVIAVLPALVIMAALGIMLARRGAAPALDPAPIAKGEPA